MDNQDATLTPERKREIAATNSFFGIRPGTRFFVVPSVFDSLPEEERPRFGFDYMTSSARQEYADRMVALLGDAIAEDAAEGEGVQTKTAEALHKRRKEHNAINEWLIRSHLKTIENYKDAIEGQAIPCVIEGGRVSDATWEAISVNLRPHLADAFIIQNFATDVEAAAVKS